MESHGGKRGIESKATTALKGAGEHALVDAEREKGSGGVGSEVG